MTTLDQDRLAEGLREQGAAFGLAVAGGDPEAKVPTCPEWRLRVLTGHAGQATRWAAGLVRAAGTPLPVPDPLDALPGAPDAWASWLRDGAEDLITAVRTAAPPAPPSGPSTGRCRRCSGCAGCCATPPSTTMTRRPPPARPTRSPTTSRPT
ncbi:maleylpyruvate isomerase N-terminal domain-containing protein [Nonomuraea salmonea]|uniref:maleylpyruvate isomerase N-terminal domain-containing protein n=1 Tax=Nonomuraea salmonea TaxID=46181 RepID=UPI002FEC5597